MKNEAVAKRYGKALAELAHEAGRIPKVMEQLETVVNAWNECDDLRQLFLSPVLTDERATVLPSVYQRLGLDEDMQKFMAIIIENRRINLLSEILEQFRYHVEDVQNKVRVSLTSARPLSIPQKEKLVSTLTTETGREIIIEEHINPSIIGGLIVAIGSQVYDGSVKTQLRNIKQALVKER